MRKIIVLSEYGFKLEDNPDKWISCDKKLLSSTIFKSLKVNDYIYDLRFNNNNFLTEFTKFNSEKFTLAQHSEQGFEGESTNSPSLNIDRSKLSCDSPSLDIKPVKNGLMYGQCVNLAFNHISNNECGLNVPEAFDLADKIYNEYVKRA